MAGTAFGLEGAGLAVVLTGAVAHEAILIDAGPWAGIVPAVLAAGTGIEIVPVVIAERGALEAVGPAACMVEEARCRVHRRARQD
jgi:hypothetical protein